jgi:hypothetical protein
MIAFACRLWVVGCGLWVVTCSWFGFNAIIVLHTHLFELKFEFAHTPIVKDTKLRMWVTCQPGVMKRNKSWMDVADLFVASTISNQPVCDRWIYHCECKQRKRECVLVGVLIVNGPTRYTQTMIQGYNVRFCYFGWEHPIFLACLLILCHLTYLTSGT